MPGIESSSAETTTRIRGMTVITLSTRNTRKARSAASPEVAAAMDTATIRISNRFQPFLKYAPRQAMMRVPISATKA